ncbi:hypothetical protein Sxan_65680 [Streptomyces xanthophaeus]|uniref:Uncharacterized protein n=1 Tax=Streptomyces xanthophaeus TaxID=67385 RepID=A0A919H470_9ACTN|nr:hypothetical protein Sxan_65680 [Streptomyces xanthophaeus]
MGRERGQAAEVELLPELDGVEEDEDDAAGAAAAVEVVEDDGFEAGVLLDEAPRLSFR